MQKDYCQYSMQKFLSTNSILSCLAAISCSACMLKRLDCIPHITLMRREGGREWRERMSGKGRREGGGREGKRKESVLLSEVFSYRGCR